MRKGLNMEKLCDNTSLEILKKDNLDKFFTENQWLDKQDFEAICKRYGFPEKELTVVIEHYYIDAVYRDAYYNYWSKTHFDWPRYCQRLFLFHNAHMSDEFFEQKFYDKLNSDFLGAIVVRPSYSGATDHTFGRTLLNPYKMELKVADDEKEYLFKYLETAEYKCHLFGNTYTTRAFPFLSQDGAVMKCAETAICELCDYASASSSQYAKVLPSDIQTSLKGRLSERILPSHGLYCNDISYLIGEFGFSPMIYAGSQDAERTENSGDEYKFDIEIGPISSDIIRENDFKIEQTWDNQHITDFKDWFHYYVDSAIPILIITAPNQEVNKHAALVIGHGKTRKTVNECEIYRLGNLPCIDTSQLYENYIVQDDNQIPYSEEKMDRFTQRRNYKLVAYIVPLDRHIFLEASSAINICDTFIAQEYEMIKLAIENIIDKYQRKAREETDIEMCEQYRYMAECMDVSEDNPVTIRYYLANSAKYKSYRIINSETLNDEKFYANVLMPKAIWVAEISTYSLYEMGYIFAEVVIDATALNRSRVNSIILLKIANLGVYRLPGETYNDFIKKLETENCYEDLMPVYNQFSNFLNEEWNTEDN